MLDKRMLKVVLVVMAVLFIVEFFVFHSWLSGLSALMKLMMFNVALVVNLAIGIEVAKLSMGLRE